MFKVPARTLEYLLPLVSSRLYNVTCRLLSKLPTLMEFYYVLKKCFTVFFLWWTYIVCVWNIWTVFFFQNVKFKLLWICCSGLVKNINSLSWFQISFINSFTPYSRGNVTFSILMPGPNPRPGYNDFYNTPSLQEFVKATQIRLHFHGQYHTTQAPVSLRRRYYAVSEITITGR